MLQKEAKEGKKDKDSDKEEEDSGKWGDWEDDEATPHWLNVEEMVVKYCTITTLGYVWLQSVQKHVCYPVRKIEMKTGVLKYFYASKLINFTNLIIRGEPWQ